MKHSYITPATTVLALSPATVLLGASDTPNVSLGQGKRTDFDVKDASVSAPSYNVWDDDWSE